MITGPQIRAARAALGWSIKDLANQTAISDRTIIRMEACGGIPTSTTANIRSIKTTLEAAGIEFIGTPDERPGVRIGQPKSTTDRKNPEL